MAGTSDDNFRAVIERSPHPMCLCRADRMIYVNPAMIEYLGYASQSPLLGPTLAELSDELIHPEERSRVRDAFRVLFVGLGGDGAKALEPVKISDIRVRRKDDGAIRVCDMHGFLVMHDGAPALVTSIEDLTERREVEARMRLADRMASLGTLAAGVAHEINNPLAFALANVALVLQKLSERGGDAELVESLAHARIGLDRIGKIVQGLKTFSRGDEETIGPVHVVPMMDSCIEMAQSVLRHRCRIQRDFDAGPPAVRGNEARLAQVVLNLLINAAQAFDEASSVSNCVEVRVRHSSDWVDIIVSDNGPGIAAHVLPRIFDPFFTTKPLGAGTGMGLSVCHGIVAALGGELTVQSVPGRGTCARVRLPVAEPSPSPSALDAECPGRRARVLVVDDEPLLLAVLKRVLDDHDLTTASSGREALELIEREPAFDVIFCDLMMPEMSGIDLFAILTESHPDIARRVVFLTGGAVTPSAARLLEHAPNPVVEKPFDPQELRRIIESTFRCNEMELSTRVRNRT